MLTIRAYNAADTEVLIKLFQQTVHTVCRKDYTQEQLDAWAPLMIDHKKWGTRLSRSFTIVACLGDQVVGFANLDPVGSIDMFYVSGLHQRRGIGNLLLVALESQARILQLTTLQSDVSLNSKTIFFGKRIFSHKRISKGSRLSSLSKCDHGKAHTLIPLTFIV